jgi:uncharacterized protein (TIGR03000 family)
MTRTPGVRPLGLALLLSGLWFTLGSGITGAQPKAQDKDVKSKPAPADKDLAKTKAELATTQKALAQTKLALAKAQADLAAAQKALAQAKKDLARKQTEAAADRKAAAQTRQALAKAQKDLTATRNALVAAGKDLATQKALHKTIQAKLDQTNKELARNRSELAATRKTLAKTQKDLLASKKDFVAAKQDLTKVQVELKSKKKALAEAVIAIEHLRKRLAAEQANRKEVTGKLHQAATEILIFQAQLALADRALTATRDLHGKTVAELKTALKGLVLATADNKRLRREVEKERAQEKLFTVMLQDTGQELDQTRQELSKAETELGAAREVLMREQEQGAVSRPDRRLRGRARFIVEVPGPGARLYVNGKLYTPVRGKVVREFVTRPLRPGQRYVYQLRVVTRRHGRRVTLKKRVFFEPNTVQQISFRGRRPRP